MSKRQTKAEAESEAYGRAFEDGYWTGRQDAASLLKRVLDPYLLLRAQGHKSRRAKRSKATTKPVLKVVA